MPCLFFKSISSSKAERTVVWESFFLFILFFHTFYSFYLIFLQIYTFFPTFPISLSFRYSFSVCSFPIFHLCSFEFLYAPAPYPGHSTGSLLSLPHFSPSPSFPPHYIFRHSQIRATYFICKIPV